MGKGARDWHPSVVGGGEMGRRESGGTDGRIECGEAGFGFGGLGEGILRVAGQGGERANGTSYLGYARRKGYRMVDGQLLSPDAWFACTSAAGRDNACGVSEDLVYKTTPQIGLELESSQSFVGGSSYYRNHPEQR